MTEKDPWSGGRAFDTRTIYDDRCEISSPGGMYGGKAIQELDIYKLKSERRNPVIADLFHRMRWMDRRGSGLRKIVNETKKLYGYSEKYAPEFYSTHSSFTVVLKNVNYIDTQTEIKNDTINDTINDTQRKILLIINENPSITSNELSEQVGITERNIKANIKTLKDAGMLEREGARKNGRWVIKNAGK